MFQNSIIKYVRSLHATCTVKIKTKIKTFSPSLVQLYEKYLYTFKCTAKKKIQINWLHFDLWLTIKHILPTLQLNKLPNNNNNKKQQKKNENKKVDGRSSKINIFLFLFFLFVFFCVQAKILYGYLLQLWCLWTLRNSVICLMFEHQRQEHFFFFYYCYSKAMPTC